MKTDVEAIRAGLDAWSQGDLEGSMKELAPEIEVVTSGVYPGLEPVYRGYAGYTRFWHDFREAWEAMRIDIERIVEGEPSRYAVVATFHATGRDGIPAERPVGMVFTMADGRTTRLQNFGSGEEALAAAGAVTP